jgi:hypothetical protein
MSIEIYEQNFCSSWWLRYPLNSQRPLGTRSRPLAFSSHHPCMGTTVMDRKNRIGRRERREILKSAQGGSEAVIDKCQLESLRPNTIPGCLRKGSVVDIANVRFGQGCLGNTGLNRANGDQLSC